MAKALGSDGVPPTTKKACIGKHIICHWSNPMIANIYGETCKAGSHFRKNICRSRGRFWRCICYECSSYNCSQALDAETKKLYAMSATLRRVCTPKPSSGKLEVSQEVYKQWKQNGEPRRALLKVLMNAGGNKDQIRVVFRYRKDHVIFNRHLFFLKTHGQLLLFHICLKDLFKKRIEHIQKRARRSSIKVQKGYYTKEKMKTVLKYTPSVSKFLFVAPSMG